MLQYFKLLSKRAFRLKFEGTDLLSTVLIAALGAADHYRPNWGIDMDSISWQTPLSFLGLIFLLRIISAPYFIWKEENLKNKFLEDKYEDPKAPQKILGPKKTYSDAEKHAISDMFSETKALLDGEIRTAELGFQNLVWQIWKINYIGSLEQFVRDAINKIDEMTSKIDAIERKFVAWKHIFRGVLGTESPNELTSLRQKLERCIEPVVAATRLHAASPPERHSDISRLLTVVSVGVSDETAKLNSWIEQSLKKIELVEVELNKK